MMENTIPEKKALSLAAKLRAKFWMARWNLLLWATFALVIAIACWQFFPGALFWVDGGLRGITLVASIDFILGPLLFILVANPAKSLRERRVDFITLFTVQVLAMAWGGWQVYTQRPVAISYMREGFAMPVTMEPFAAQHITPDALPASRLGKMPAFFVDLPTGKNAAQAYHQAIQKHLPLTAQATLLRPLFSHEAEMLSATPRFQHYWTGEGAAAWHEWAAGHDGQPATNYRFILLAGRYGNAALVLDAQNTVRGHIRLPDGDPTLILPAK
jgi:hypothetical protein